MDHSLSYGRKLVIAMPAYLTSIYFVGNLKKALAQRRDGFLTHENHQAILLRDVERDRNIFGAKLIHQKTKTNCFFVVF